MFLGFFNLLRSYGLKVSMQEWMSLMQALEMDLGNSTLTGFYHLCRCILVKSEADYDTLDKVFALYFKNIKSYVSYYYQLHCKSFIVKNILILNFKS